MTGVLEGQKRGGGVGVAGVAIRKFPFLCSLRLLAEDSRRYMEEERGHEVDVKTRKGGLRIPGTVGTADVLTIWTYPHPNWEQRRTRMTRPPNPLHRLLPD